MAVFIALSRIFRSAVVHDPAAAFLPPGVVVPVMEPVRELLRSREIGDGADRIVADPAPRGFLCPVSRYDPVFGGCFVQ